ncbi:hypothetical protein ABZ619_29680 [Streptomyces sp. NPDC007851]|uniref:hypothetical protein n=1 Tax=Streptomyces sp. NPDC007851 TaxID=3155008 RepID=UPI0033EA68CB
MTRPTAQKPALRVAETGWAKKHHLPPREVRTCMAAVADESAPSAAGAGAEWNIVRGDD